MNIGLLMNLPVLTMLNKSARQLIHAHLVTVSIDPVKKTCKLKPYVHQLNQSSGKSYWKYPRALVNGKRITLERINYNLPSKELIEAYEKKKAKFLTDMTLEYSKEYDKIELDKVKSMARNDLSDVQLEVFNMLNEGLKPKEIAEKRGTNLSNIYNIIQNIKKKGYTVQIEHIPLENPLITL
jgi:DNA-binding CsgD family transcriptional regulator